MAIDMPSEDGRSNTHSAMQTEHGLAKLPVVFDCSDPCSRVVGTQDWAYGSPLVLFLDALDRLNPMVWHPEYLVLASRPQLYLA